MKAKKEGNWYDKIFKENLEAVTMTLVEKVLGIDVVHAEKVPTDLQRTLERKPDQVLRITDRRGDTFVLHLEFQLADEPGMVDRMYEYRGLLRRKHRLLVRQYVLFLADTEPRMPDRIEEENLFFAFRLVWLAQVDYRVFLDSPKADEVVFAVLGHFGGDDPAAAAVRIVDRLANVSRTQLELEKHLEQLRILANLRKLKPFVEQLMESISKYIKPEDDYLYKKGEERGEKRGEERGEERGVRKTTAKVILRFLKDGILTTTQIAAYFDVSEQFVEELRASGSGKP